MNKITLYIREAYNELQHKVTWPTWTELQGTAVVVLVAILMIAAGILIMDQASTIVLEQYYNLVG